MSTLGNYYIDNPQFEFASGVYTDAALTISAPDGWYSNGVIARRQISGVLGAVQECGDLAPACPVSISTTVYQGEYTTSAETGSDPTTDLGAILIYFNPNSVANGIRARLGSVWHNELTSPVDGYHAASFATSQFTIIGDDSASGGAPPASCPNFTIVNTPKLFDSYYYKPNIGYVMGGLVTRQVIPSMVSLSSGVAPGNCLMVVPKINVANTKISVSILGVCEVSEWDLEIRCPVLLTGVPASNIGATCGTATYPNTFYNAPVDGVSFGDPNLYDFIFGNVYGSTKFPAGVYKVNTAPNAKLITIDANGVVTNVVICP
jgi:hypothetical protein